jgi:hypothetical protein
MIMKALDKFESDINSILEKNGKRPDIVHKLLTNILEDEFADEQLKTEYLKIILKNS